jgi:hypothetical protein
MATKEKLAVPLDFQPSIVVLNNGERMTLKEAKAAGYKIFGEPDDPAPVLRAGEENLRAHKTWRSTILGMPEARNRESAAVELVTTQNRETMSIEAARAFLRGLPTEQAEEPTATMTMNPDPRATRLAEIEGSMKAFNTSRGHAGKPRAAVSAASVDPVKLQRLADIRLAAITMRIGQGEASLQSEHKKLSYAMSVHAQTGLPLATVFQQLGVDTSKMLA